MRAFNRVLSAVLAAVLVVAGVLTILEICRAALSQPPAVVQWPKLLPKLRDNSYDDLGPILVCVGLAVLGLLILTSGIKRGKPYAVPAGSTAPGVRTEINRRSLERAMRAAVVATARVEGGTVTLRRRSARIIARANTHAIEGLDADIRQRVEGLLNSIALVEPPKLKIKTYAAPATAAPQSAQAGADVPAGAQPPATAPTPRNPAPRAESIPDPNLSPQAGSSPEFVAEPAALSPPPAVTKPNPQPRPRPKVEPKPERNPKPDPGEPGTARLDDLLFHPEDDEPR